MRDLVLLQRRGGRLGAHHRGDVAGKPPYRLDILVVHPHHLARKRETQPDQAPAPLVQRRHRTFTYERRENLQDPRRVPESVPGQQGSAGNTRPGIRRFHRVEIRSPSETPPQPLGKRLLHPVDLQRVRAGHVVVREDEQLDVLKHVVLITAETVERLDLRGISAALADRLAQGDMSVVGAHLTCGHPPQEPVVPAVHGGTLPTGQPAAVGQGVKTAHARPAQGQAGVPAGSAVTCLLAFGQRHVHLGEVTDRVPAAQDAASARPAFPGGHGPPGKDQIDVLLSAATHPRRVVHLGVREEGTARLQPESSLGRGGRQ